MGVQEREYMGEARPDPDIELDTIGGVVAKNQSDAERILKFACPTQDANGKWYRTTLAVSNVPVHVLYNVLSNMTFIAQHLREIAARTDSPEVAEEIRRQAGFIDLFYRLLKQTDSDPAMFPGQHLHPPKETGT